MGNKRTCPLCSKDVVDFLKHLRFTHDISSAEELDEKIKKMQKSNNNIIEFDKFVEKLKVQMNSGEISPEKYRELITRWNKEHSNL